MTSYSPNSVRGPFSEPRFEGGSRKFLSRAKDRRSTSYISTLVGMLCYASMLAVTFAGNMPVNRRMLEMDTDSVSGEELVGLRRRWDRFHAVRNVLNFLGFASALLGLSEDTAN